MNIMNIKKNIVKYIPDSLYLRRTYRKMMGCKLNLKKPRTFNEKMQWLKIHDRNPQYTTMVDKYSVKAYVSDIIGKQFIIPTIGMWDSFDEIDFDVLPEQFVLKCTHDSGGVVICKDKKKLDIEKVKEKLEHSLQTNYYYCGREWPYKNVKPRIIAEKYIADNLQDYKLFCFNGVPKITLVCSERFSKNGLKEDFYDQNWNHLEIERSTHPNATVSAKCPKQYELMKKLATKLSQKIPFVRVDFYEIDGNIYFGEMTFYPAGGFEGFKPVEWDMKLGEWIELPNRK